MGRVAAVKRGGEKGLTVVGPQPSNASIPPRGHTNTAPMVPHSYLGHWRGSTRVAAGVHQAPPSPTLAGCSRRRRAQKGPACAGLPRAEPPVSLVAARPVVPMVRCRPSAATPTRAKTRARLGSNQTKGSHRNQFLPTQSRVNGIHLIRESECNSFPLACWGPLDS